MKIQNKHINNKKVSKKKSSRKPEKKVIVPKKKKYKAYFSILVVLQVIAVFLYLVIPEQTINFFANLSNYEYLEYVSMLFFKVTGKFKIFSGALMTIAYVINVKMTLGKAKKKNAKEYNSNLQKWHELTTMILLALAAPPYSLSLIVYLIIKLHYKNVEYNKK